MFAFKHTLYTICILAAYFKMHWVCPGPIIFCLFKYLLILVVHHNAVSTKGFVRRFSTPFSIKMKKKVRKLNYCTFKGHNQSSPNRLYGYCINNCKRSYVNQSFSIEKRRFLILNCPQNENENSKTLLQFYRTPLSKRCFGYCVKCKRNGNQAPRP